MKITVFVILSGLLTLTACTSTQDVTAHPEKWTDFREGKIYQLKLAVYAQRGMMLCKFYGDKELEQKYRTAKPSWIEGFFERGTLIKIKKITVTRAPETGIDVEIFGEILSGNYKGETVTITRISTLKYGGPVVRDPDMLEPPRR